MAKEPKVQTDLQEQMNAAAKDAVAELKATMTGKQVSDWMKKWYMKAGYKRLSRELMNFFK